MYSNYRYDIDSLVDTYWLTVSHIQACLWEKCRWSLSRVFGWNGWSDIDQISPGEKQWRQATCYIRISVTGSHKAWNTVVGSSRHHDVQCPISIVIMINIWHCIPQHSIYSLLVFLDLTNNRHHCVYCTVFTVL